LLAAGCALPFVRPLCGQHDTQVANAQALAKILIFSHFSIDINTYQLYNFWGMVRNEWKNGDGIKTGFQCQMLKLGTLKLGNHDFCFLPAPKAHSVGDVLISQFMLFLRHSTPPRPIKVNKGQ
jgi:hypothetical protein